MRVVAGQWRGRVLLSPEGDGVRPTADKVKEALFSILGPNVAGSLFVDLCCGAGGLAVEALSRGAARVILVDQARASLDVARSNLELCGAAPGSFDLTRSDCLGWLEKWRPPRTPWYLVGDPPYHSELPWAILEHVKRLAGSEGFRAGVIEHESDVDLVGDGDGECPTRIDVRRYGRCSLTIVRPR